MLIGTTRSRGRKSLSQWALRMLSHRTRSRTWYAAYLISYPSPVPLNHSNQSVLSARVADGGSDGPQLGALARAPCMPFQSSRCLSSVHHLQPLLSCSKAAVPQDGIITREEFKGFCAVSQWPRPGQMFETDFADFREQFAGLAEIQSANNTSGGPGAAVSVCPFVLSLVTICLALSSASLHVCLSVCQG